MLIRNRIESEDQRWLQFFKVGDQLNDEALPDWMTTSEMKQAMSTLNLFSEKERQYYQYQARQEYLREQKAIQLEFEQATQQLEQTSQQLEQTTKELLQAKLNEEAALVEIERLKAQLASKDR